MAHTTNPWEAAYAASTRGAAKFAQLASDHQSTDGNRPLCLFALISPVSLRRIPLLRNLSYRAEMAAVACVTRAVPSASSRLGRNRSDEESLPCSSLARHVSGRPGSCTTTLAGFCQATGSGRLARKRRERKSPSHFKPRHVVLSAAAEPSSELGGRSSPQCRVPLAATPSPHRFGPVVRLLQLATDRNPDALVGNASLRMGFWHCPTQQRLARHPLAEPLCLRRWNPGAIASRSSRRILNALCRLPTAGASASADQLEKISLDLHRVRRIVQRTANLLGTASDFRESVDRTAAHQELAHAPDFLPIAFLRRTDHAIDVAGQPMEITRHTIVVAGQLGGHPADVRLLRWVLSRLHNSALFGGLDSSLLCERQHEALWHRPSRGLPAQPPGRSTGRSTRRGCRPVNHSFET